MLDCMQEQCFCTSGQLTLGGSCSCVLSFASLALSCPKWYSVACTPTHGAARHSAAVNCTSWDNFEA